MADKVLIKGTVHEVAKWYTPNTYTDDFDPGITRCNLEFNWVGKDFNYVSSQVKTTCKICGCRRNHSSGRNL